MILFVLATIALAGLAPRSFGQAVDPNGGRSGTVSVKAATPSEADAKAEKDKKTNLRVLQAIGFGLCSGLLGGYLLGKARSPKFDDPTESPALIRRYVTEHCTFEIDPFPQGSHYSSIDCVVRRNDNGDLKSIGPVGRYLFSCGIVTYGYDVKSQQLLKNPFHAATDHKHAPPPRNGFNFKETTAIMIGGAEGYSLKSTGSFLVESAGATKDSNESLRMVFYACIGLISGVVFGFWLGYEGKPKCGDVLFQHLLNDPIFWEGIADTSDFLAEESRKSHWWEIWRDKAGVHVAKGGCKAPWSFSTTPFSAGSVTALRNPFALGSPGDGFPEVFGEPEQPLLNVLQVIGEDSLAKELVTQVGKSNGIDWGELRRGLRLL